MKTKFLVSTTILFLLAGMVFTSFKKDEEPANPPITGEALFSFTADGKTVTFKNESTVSGTVTYAWEFGDEATSTEKDPVHTYEFKGEYTVKLTVTDEQGGTHPVSTKVKVDKKTRIDLNDGSFDDWDAVTEDKFIVPLGDNSGVVTVAKYDYDADNIYAYIEFEGDIANEYQYDMFFDFDNDSTTGFTSYLWPASGAEFLPEIWSLTTDPVINFYNYIGAPGEEDWNWEEKEITDGMAIGTLKQVGGKDVVELGFSRTKITGLENDEIGLGCFISDVDWAEIGFAPDATVEFGPHQAFFILDMR
jgi:hypothetical protein